MCIQDVMDAHHLITQVGPCLRAPPSSSSSSSSSSSASPAPSSPADDVLKRQQEYIIAASCDRHVPSSFPFGGPLARKSSSSSEKEPTSGQAAPAVTAEPAKRKGWFF